MNVAAAAEDTAEDKSIVERRLEGDTNGVVEITAEDAARDTGVAATIVVGMLVNAVPGDLVVSAAPAVPAVAGVVVTGALELALRVGWLEAPVLDAGSRPVVGDAVGGGEVPSVVGGASVLARLVGTVVVGGAVDSGTVDVEALDTGTVDSGSLDVGAVDVGTVDSGSVDVGSIDVGAVDVAPTTDETGTTEFSWTALDDALDCWPSLPLR